MWMWCRKLVILRCREPDACGKWISYRFSVRLSHTMPLKPSLQGMCEAILYDCKMATVHPFTWQCWTLTPVSHPLFCQPVEYESHGGCCKSKGRAHDKRSKWEHEYHRHFTKLKDLTAVWSDMLYITETSASGLKVKDCSHCLNVWEFENSLTFWEIYLLGFLPRGGWVLFSLFMLS